MVQSNAHACDYLLPAIMVHNKLQALTGNSRDSSYPTDYYLYRRTASNMEAGSGMLDVAGRLSGAG